MNVRSDLDVETLLIGTLSLLIGIVVLYLLGSLLAATMSVLVDVLVPVLVVAVLVLTVLWLFEHL